jgi:cytoskeleton protein RodZ
MADIDQDQLFGSSIGERLRAAREEKGLSLEDIARQTRIPIRHLQHIERGEWEALPAATYSVGFARSYANAVGLDGPAIGTELREQLGVARGGGPAAASYYEPADPARVPPRSLAIAAALLALILVAGYLAWRSNAVEDPPAEALIVEAEPAAPAAPAGQARAPAPAEAAAAGPVVLSATAEVWLRIYEAGGQRLFEGTMRPGQRYEVPAGAQAPQILTGRPDALQVTVGPTPIPPLGPPERTIADVSLRAADLLARTRAGAPPAASPPPPAKAQ